MRRMSYAVAFLSLALSARARRHAAADPGSLQSSLGTFLTGATHRGKRFPSLRLHGLGGTNDRAEARAIVLHGADYVNAGIVGQLGRLGRRHGCPALSRLAAPRVIRLIQDGTILFAYHYRSLRRELAVR